MVDQPVRKVWASGNLALWKPFLVIRAAGKAAEKAATGRACTMHALALCMCSMPMTEGIVKAKLKCCIDCCVNLLWCLSCSPAYICAEVGIPVGCGRGQTTAAK